MWARIGVWWNNTIVSSRFDACYTFWSWLFCGTIASGDVKSAIIRVSIVKDLGKVPQESREMGHHGTHLTRFTGKKHVCRQVRHVSPKAASSVKTQGYYGYRVNQLSSVSDFSSWAGMGWLSRKTNIPRRRDRQAQRIQMHKQRI